MSKKRKYLGASLREDLDADLIEAVEKLDSTSKSELVRQGVRIVLGITTHKVTEVRERAITMPSEFLRKRTRGGSMQQNT